MIFVIYSQFFNHGPAEHIMAANRQGDRVKVKAIVRGTTYADESPDELEQQLEAELTQAAEKWEQFIKQHQYVSIGEIYDNCDENDRLMVGKTIMLPDTDTKWKILSSGMKTRTFINVTIDSEVFGGKIYHTLKYKGYNVNNKSWDLCTFDENDGADRIINCPFLPGDHSFVKDIPIPGYYAKGQYEYKGWITNQDDETILCGFSTFTL